LASVALSKIQKPEDPMLGQNSQLYVLIFVVLLLLVLLWFLVRDPWKEYGPRKTAGLIASNPELKKIDWSDISAPDVNTGLMTTTGFYNLAGNAGKIGIIASGKDKGAIQKFTEEVKFHFEPIFEQLPSDPLPQIRGLFSQNDRRVDKSQKNMPARERSSTNAQISEEKDDLFVEIAAKPNAQVDTGKRAQAIAYMIDPTLGNNKSTAYSYKGTYAYDTISVRTGSVRATLTPGAPGKDKVDVQSGEVPGTGEVSSDSYRQKRNFKLAIKGKGGAANTYRLCGIWNKPYED
jgi:hypothetical protein